MNDSKDEAGAQTDALQDLLTTYASELTFDSLTSDAVNAAKLRVIDTIGALLGGFFGEPCRLSRNLAAKFPQNDGATVFGTRLKTTPDMAAFANATTARYMEFNDTRHYPGSNGGHVSDVLMPVLAAAEYVHASGEEFITAAVVAYETFIRISDAHKLHGWDYPILSGVSVAVGAAKVFGLQPSQIHHAISMAVVPNNPLRQTRSGEISMWKAGAAGQAGRAGVFAALLAREDFEGPQFPFAGEYGWFDLIAHHRYDLQPAAFGGNGNTFMIEETLIKIRPSQGQTISSILAAEQAHAQIGSVEDIAQISVETYLIAKENSATAERCWNPTSRESADHSIPYVVAAALLDGTITQRQFDASHLANAQIRTMMLKMEVVDNPDFTRDYESLPMQHRTRVTVVMNDGRKVVGESGGSAGDLATPRDGSFINDKFISLAQESLGIDQVRCALHELWTLETMDDVADVPQLLVI